MKTAIKKQQYLQLSNNDVIKCIICGNEYKPKATNQKYCSKLCRNKAYSATMNKNYITKEELFKDCAECGKPFATTRPNKKYCGEQCREKAERHRHNRKPSSVLGRSKSRRNSPLQRYSQYKLSAKSRRHKFTLTMEQFMTYWNKPCMYCGSEIVGIGIDRYYSNKGYTIDNTLPCCRTCNTMKLDHTYNEFIEHISRIYKKAQPITVKDVDSMDMEMKVL